MPTGATNWKDLMDGVETWSRTVTTEKCLAALNDHGVPCSAYRTVAEALSDPQIAHRGALAEVEDDGGTFKVMNLPFRMSGANVSAESARRPWANTPSRSCGRPVFPKMKSPAFAGKSPVAAR